LSVKTLIESGLREINRFPFLVQSSTIIGDSEIIKMTKTIVLPLIRFDPKMEFYTSCGGESLLVDCDIPPVPLPLILKVDFYSV